MKITAIDCLNIDDRGYVAEYAHERKGNHLLIFSREGSVRGRHYHKGISVTKNPEVLILLTGKMKVNWKIVGEEMLSSITVQAPAKLEIPPMVWHELIAESDSSIIEQNSIDEHAADTFYDA
jgi:dTDP-4-dehydrorhamnose 3,5-epimerase-like enzyme